MATDPTTLKLAVLIDADNAKPSVASAILAEVAKYGTAHVRRAYGDWTTANLKSWKEVALAESIQPIQQFSYTQGKNATDSAMIIDAMDLLYTNRFDAFCLVSSDSDFTRLASRIRESGLVVYGFGERKTPKPFVSACDKFVYFENLEVIPASPAAMDQIQAATQPVLKKPMTPTGTATTNSTTGSGSTTSPSATGVKIDPHLKIQLRKAVQESSDEDGWANLAKVGALMTKRLPDFDPRSYGFLKFGEFMKASNMFEFNRQTPGPGKPTVVYARYKWADTV